MSTIPYRSVGKMARAKADGMNPGKCEVIYFGKTNNTKTKGLKANRA